MVGILLVVYRFFLTGKRHMICVALTGWLGTVYIWGTFGQKVKNAVP